MSPQVLVDGLIAGSMIGLGAIGVTLTYSILRFANFAHGDFLAWGAYFALALSGALGSLAGGALAICFAREQFRPQIELSELSAFRCIAREHGQGKGGQHGRKLAHKSRKLIMRQQFRIALASDPIRIGFRRFREATYKGDPVALFERL